MVRNGTSVSALECSTAEHRSASRGAAGMEVSERLLSLQSSGTPYSGFKAPTYIHPE